MRYKEYLVKSQDLEKKLGILGENHIYTLEESDFARRIINDFDTIAVEGSNKNGILPWIGLLTGIPADLAYVAATDRSIFCDTLREIARAKQKNIIHLEEISDLELFPAKQILALAFYSLLASITSPYTYFFIKKYGDPYKKGTISYERRIKWEKKKSLISKLNDYAYHGNLDRRDRLMAQKSKDIITNGHDNLLINVGNGHLDGIIKNLSKEVDLEEIKSIEIN